MRLGVAEPQEDEWAFCPLTGRTVLLNLVFPRRAGYYDRFLALRAVSEGERSEWKSALTWFVRKLSSRYGRPLVLKSPGHTCRLRLLLDLFPGARFVHIHRNPYVVFQSACHAVRKVSPWSALQRPNFSGLEDRTIGQYREVYDVFFEERGLIPQGHFHEVSFEELKQDPLGQVRGIYRALDLPAFGHVEPALRRYLDSLAGYTKNTFPELPADLRHRIAREWRMITPSSAILTAVFLCHPLAQGTDQSVTVSEAKKDADGLLVHEVQSPYQAGKTEIRVLFPGKREEGKRYPVVYILPVEAGNENRYGDGLLEVKKHDLHNKLRAVFVAPTFSHLPWYADHPTKADIRQETYFLKAVLPFIGKTYAVKADAGGRLLLGFSKSGWGAFSLLLRHPDVFGKAAAWDAPLMMEQPNRFGMGDVFGTQENFEKYQITKLLGQRADNLQKGKRLLLVGHANFKDHHERAHALMMKLKIDHEYRDGPVRKHEWGSGWVPEAVGLLLPGREER